MQASSPQTPAAVPPMRPAIRSAVIVCALIALAPWASGGRDALALLISMAALMTGGLLLARGGLGRGLPRGPLPWAYGALVAWSALSLIWSVNRYDSILATLQLVSAGAAFALVYAAAGETAFRRYLASGYLMVAAVFAGYGFYVYLTDAYPRFTGSFFWANPAAAFLLPAVLIAVDRALSSRGRTIWALAGAAFAACFVLADSRAATIVMVPLLLFVIFMRAQRRRNWVTLLFIAVIAAAVTFGAGSARLLIQHDVKSTTPGARFTEALSGESQSGSDRLQYLESAARIWVDNPVLGSGAGTFGAVHPGYQTDVVSASANVHNLFVQQFAELGTVGGGLIIMVVALLGIGVVRGMGDRADRRVIGVAAGGLVLYFALDIAASFPADLALSAVLMGLAYEPRRRAMRTAAASPWIMPSVALVACVPLALGYLGATAATRGAAAQADEDYELAARYYAQATSYGVYDPDWVTAEGINRLQLASVGEGDLAAEQRSALAAARRAERLDPRDGQHHQLEGRALSLSGELNGATAALQAALRLDPNNHPDYAYDLSRLQRAAGNRAAAVVTARAMLAKYPADVMANRSADASLRPALVGLAVSVGNDALERGDTNEARHLLALARVYDATDFRTRAFANAVVRADD